MPSRVLREGILDSDAVNALSFPAEVFYRRLMSVVDDFGRFDGRANVLRSRLYPLLIDKVREADISRWVAECAKAGLIALYAVDGKPYILFHKVDAPRSQTPKFPAPPEESCSQPRTPADARAGPYTPVNGRVQTPASVPYSGSTSESGSESGSESNISPEPAKPPDPVPVVPPADAVLSFPTVGTGPREWHLTAGQVAEWQGLFPAVAVADQCRAALAWVRADPTRAKTAKGMPRFLVGWLNRQTNAGGRPPTHGGPAAPPRPPAETPMEKLRRIHAETQAHAQPAGGGP